MAMLDFLRWLCYVRWSGVFSYLCVKPFLALCAKYVKNNVASKCTDLSLRVPKSSMAVRPRMASAWNVGVKRVWKDGELMWSVNKSNHFTWISSWCPADSGCNETSSTIWRTIIPTFYSETQMISGHFQNLVSLSRSGGGSQDTSASTTWCRHLKPDQDPWEVLPVAATGSALFTTCYLLEGLP